MFVIGSCRKFVFSVSVRTTILYVLNNNFSLTTFYISRRCGMIITREAVSNFYFPYSNCFYGSFTILSGSFATLSISNVTSLWPLTYFHLFGTFNGCFEPAPVKWCYYVFLSFFSSNCDGGFNIIVFIAHFLFILAGVLFFVFHQ